MADRDTLQRLRQNELIRRTAERRLREGFDPQEDELRLAATTPPEPPPSEEIDSLCTTSPD